MKACFVGWNRVCQTLPIYKAELLIDDFETNEATIDKNNGSTTNTRKRKATIDSRPKIANAEVEARSVMMNVTESLAPRVLS